jgi:hypothetical protein
MVPFLAALTGASSVLLIATWYAFSKGRADARLRTLMEPQRMVLEQADPFTQRVAFPVVDGLVNAFAAVLPTRLVTRANAWLVTAGDRTSLPQFLSIVLMLAAGFGAAAWAALALITGEPLRAISSSSPSPRPLPGSCCPSSSCASPRRAARSRSGARCRARSTS